MNALQHAAAEYLDAGLSVVPIANLTAKTPAGPWKLYQTERATLASIPAWFAANPGVAIICGEVSNNLTVMDFDSRGPRGLLYADWAAVVGQTHPGLVEQLPMVQSQRGGVHLYFRCARVDGNQRLALDLPTPETNLQTGEIRDVPHPAIETRGRGGYVLAPPSHGYTLVRGHLGVIPEIMLDEYRAFLDAARSFDLTPTDPETTEPEQRTPHQDDPDNPRPGTTYNLQATTQHVVDTLASAGWSIAHTRRDGTVCLTRPGKSAREGISGTIRTGTGGVPIFYNFSTAGAPFRAEKGYSPFQVYALLEHHGNFSAAASALHRAAHPPLRLVQRDGGGPDASGDTATATAIDVFNLTDLGNARRLVALHGHAMRYVHEWGWLVWNGGYWERDTTGAVARLTREMIDGLYVEASAMRRAGDDDGAKKLAQWAFKSESASHMDAVVHVAQKEQVVVARTSQFDTDPWVLPCANGTVDLRTGLLYPSDPEHYATKASPVIYDRAATAPTWLAFLDRVLPDPEVRAFVQRYAGYTLTGSAREECLAFLYGSGGNGKSTFLTMMRNVLGSFAVTTAPQTLMVKKGDDGATNDIAMLAGARMVATIEVEDGKRMAESLIKSMTGRDALTCRFLHKEFFSFVPTFKVWFAANHKPVIRGSDEAIWRRIRMVPFGERITDAERRADPTFADRLALELPGMLNWCLAGCIAWQRDGLQTPKIVEEATQSYRDEMDILGPFLDECCLTNQKLKVRTKASDLYHAYTAWCQRAGEEALKQRTFSLKIAERGIIRERGKGNEYEWAGLKLREEGERNYTFTPEAVTKVTNSTYSAYAGAHKGNIGKSSNPSNLVTPEPDDDDSDPLSNGGLF